MGGPLPDVRCHAPPLRKGWVPPAGGDVVAPAASHPLHVMAPHPVHGATGSRRRCRQMTGHHSHVELRHLEYFVAVAEELSFTRASRRLHVVQSGVPSAIQGLERELGAALSSATGTG